MDEEIGLLYSFLDKSDQDIQSLSKALLLRCETNTELDSHAPSFDRMPRHPTVTVVTPLKAWPQRVSRAVDLFKQQRCTLNKAQSESS